MKENGKRRDWVKNAAIVFLAVMLVLTLFSNTFMNYSLPEVATQWVQSGSITAKIRGSGIVESGDPYEIKATESRKVASVAVRVGDTVEKGQVLLYLEDAESDELKKAKSDLETAEQAYELALLTANITSSDINNANKDVSLETLRKRITNAQASLRNTENELKDAEDAAQPFQDKVDELTQTIANFDTEISYAQKQDQTAEDWLKKAEEAWNLAKKACGEVSGSDAATVQNAQNALTNAQKIYDDAKAAAEARRTSPLIANLQTQKNKYEYDLYCAQRDQKAAQAEVDRLTKEKAEKENALKELEASVGNVTNLQKLLGDISKAQELVDELEGKATGATINADIAGTVSAVNVVAGNTTAVDSAVVVLQPEGKGYTMSFSVTNEQARRLAVGDRADLINAWRYDDVVVTLASIKPDKNEPGQKKLLTFDVTGSITAGQTLNISVGQKSANYDLIVPNSAIREDANGKFILTVESKSSPLGNRYVATRVDIEVLASDDTQSAISGGIYGYEYVITTSTKPVEAGQLVRPKDN